MNLDLNKLERLEKAALAELASNSQRTSLLDFTLALRNAASTPCSFPVALTTCGYKRNNHFRADGSPMGHPYTPTGLLEAKP